MIGLMGTEQVPPTLLQALQTAGIKLWVEEGNRLKASAPDGALTPPLREQIGTHKAALVALLAQTRSAQNGTIPPVARTSPLPLSFAQQRLWFLDQMDDARTAYNIPLALRLTGVLDVQALRVSLATIMQRHESLRTIFALHEEQPVQVVQEAVPLLWTERSLVDTADRDGVLQQLLLEEAERLFSLNEGPLWRITLIQLAAQEHVLLITLHHITGDGWSVGVLMQELTTLYRAHVQGVEPSLSPLPIQYADFAQWQRQTLQGERLAAQLNFWAEHLAGAPDLLELPTDHKRPPRLRYRGDYQVAALPVELVKAINALSVAAQTTPFMTLYAAFVTLLYRLTHQTDIVVGTPVANRTRRELEPLIGFFVNLLPLRTTLTDTLTFRELLAQVRQTASHAYQHQDVPFEYLVERLQPTRDLSYAPITQVNFVVQERIGDLLLPGIKSTLLNPVTISAKFDLEVELVATETGAMRALWVYNTDLFAAETIQRLMRHFSTLLTGMVANPDQAIGQFPLLTAAEHRQILIEWNDTATDYPRDKCLHQLFEEQAARTPDAVALVFDDHQGTSPHHRVSLSAQAGTLSQLTYRELNERANQLAHYLQGVGVGPETLVGICIPRSLTMIVGLLGILKAGGAYVPLDPSYPQERLAFMLQDADVHVLLTQASLQESLPSTAAQVICLDSDWDQISKQDRHTPHSLVESHDRAYVIYTSGSTGRPKGVQALHQAAVNRLVWMWRTMPFAQNEVCAQKTALSFVDSVWEIFGPLLQGVPSVVIPDMLVKDTPHFIAILSRHQVTRLVLVPSLLRTMLESEPELQAHLANVTHWVCSGEALSIELVQNFYRQMPKAKLINLYGSSEVAGDATWYDTSVLQNEAAQRLTTIPIGQPISNTQCYILDGMLQPVPLGIQGELYIGGDGLARGYHQRPALTKERFIPNPFGPGRLFKTGDLARWRLSSSTPGARPDIEFLGRLAHQVKIRGFRIELGEIEAQLVNDAAVRAAIVLVREGRAGDKQLVAYIVPDPAGQPTATEPSTHALHDKLQATLIPPLRRRLAAQLPDYMIPNAFVLLDALPLTPNGKIDR